MKHIMLIILLALLSSFLLSDVISLEKPMRTAEKLDRTTEGTLSFSVRTVTYHGQYGPRNSGVIWITNAANQFVKTIKVWAIPYRYTLIRWNASSGGNVTGAITGASLNNHQLHNVSWNGTNYQGTQVPDGDYKINVEFTEHNATASNMGKFKQVTFTKGPNAVNQTIPNETYFQNMTLTWQPVVANGSISGYVVNNNINPVHLAQVQAGPYSTLTNTEGYYSLTLPPGSYDVSCTSTSYTTQTAYGIVVLSGQNTSLNFELATVSNSDELLPGADLMLLNPQPNPFKESSKIRYFTDSTQRVEAAVYNARGQKIVDLAAPAAKTGSNELQWDGRDLYGRRCSSGIYYIRLRQGDRSRTQKLQLLN